MEVPCPFGKWTFVCSQFASGRLTTQATKGGAARNSTLMDACRQNAHAWYTLRGLTKHHFNVAAGCSYDAGLEGEVRHSRLFGRVAFLNHCLLAIILSATCTSRKTIELHGSEGVLRCRPLHLWQMAFCLLTTCRWAAVGNSRGGPARDSRVIDVCHLKCSVCYMLIIQFISEQESSQFCFSLHL